MKWVMALSIYLIVFQHEPVSRRIPRLLSYLEMSAKAQNEVVDKQSLIKKAVGLLYDPKWIKIAAIAMFLAEVVFCAGIIYKIPYTEIDWIAYMQQVKLFKAGETDYMNIKGDTGPLVYPGGHVAIFSVLYDLTDNGTNIFKAQMIFAAVYLATQAMVLNLYVKYNVPVHYTSLLVLSKRLHSIYLLRLFNDCFCTFFIVAATTALEYNLLPISSLLFSAALSVKMNALLVLPGAAIAYYQKMRSVPRAITRLGPPFLALQMAAAYPFRDHLPSYFSRAFEFSRQFLYQWTVNWKFVPEDVFLGKNFALTLLAVHISLLILFAIKQLAGESRGPLHLIACANLIGILCARSLHYQFYSWFFWTVPYLAYTSSLSFVLAQALIVGQEMCWNVFPATSVSSQLAVAALGILVFENVLF